MSHRFKKMIPGLTQKSMLQLDFNQSLRKQFFRPYTYLDAAFGGALGLKHPFGGALPLKFLVISKNLAPHQRTGVS